MRGGKVVKNRGNEKKSGRCSRGCQCKKGESGKLLEMIMSKGGEGRAVKDKNF